MNSERACLVQIGSKWIDLSKIEWMDPAPSGAPGINRVHLACGGDIIMPDDLFQLLMDKLQSFGMLAS